MQAVLLVGGLGTRLRKTVSDRPKSMALINGKPFLEYQIRFLKKNNICDIMLLTGYMSEKIEEHFGSGQSFDVSIRYIKETELLGTGGSIKNAMDVLDEQFLVSNGDSLFLVDINSMMKFHKNVQADLTMALAKTCDKSRFGSVLTNASSQIVNFGKRNLPGELINGGIYFFEKSRFKWKEFPTKFSIEHDFFPQVIQQNKVFGFISNSYFIDIGITEDYKKLGEDLNLGIVTF